MHDRPEDTVKQTLERTRSFTVRNLADAHTCYSSGKNGCLQAEREVMLLVVN